MYLFIRDIAGLDLASLLKLLQSCAEQLLQLLPFICIFRAKCILQHSVKEIEHCFTNE